MGTIGGKVIKQGWVPVLALVVLAACSQKTAPVAQCADPLRGCWLAWDGKGADVRFLAAPGGLKPFGLQVAAPGANAVSASFSMRDMDMGENRYRLVRGTDGAWRADVILPVCVAGRADWTMTLEVDGSRVAMPFVAGGN